MQLGRQGRAAIQLAALVGGAALVSFLLGRRTPRRRRRPKPNPWVTLSNRRRVHITDEGRLDKGLPADFQGVHVGDLSEYGRRSRQIAEDEQACSSSGRKRRQSIRSAEEFAGELLAANPDLGDFLQVEAKGSGERAYLAWLAGGRRGKRPRLAAGDGRFDAINERFERKGGRAVASWHEAIRAVMPASRRWGDVAGRLEALEDATGLRLNLPAPAEAIELDRSDAEACAGGADRARDDLWRRATGGRLAAAAEEVPF